MHRITCLALLFNKHHLGKTRWFSSLMKANQSGLYSLSLIQLNVRNSHRCLSEDLIILLISNYFKDKWVHLASTQICQWWTRETVPSSLLSVEINGLMIKPFFFVVVYFIFSHLKKQNKNRLQFMKAFLIIAVIFLLIYIHEKSSMLSALSWNAVVMQLICV